MPPKIFASTQEHLEIVDIKDGIIVLTGGRFRIVLEATAINFDLLSEAEQDAAIYAYANMVNSLDFPIQVLIRTRQIDITNYLIYLTKFEKQQPNSALKEQLLDYLEFIKQLVVENTVLQKNFYVVIPYMVLETQKLSIFELLLQNTPIPFLNKPEELQGYTYDEKSLEESKRIFGQREEELVWQFRRLGIKTQRLKTAELIRLFYEIYNPEAGENQTLKEDPRGFMSPLVKPAVI